MPYLNRNGSKRNLNLNWFDNDWNPDCRFLAVRYAPGFSRSSTGGSFALQLPAPPAEHPAYFRKIFGKMRVLFRIKRLHIPRELKEEFQKVNTRDTAINKHDLFRMRAITCEKTVLNRMQEDIVYLRPEREAVRFREVR